MASHARAGDAVAIEPTLLLTLVRTEMEMFKVLVPGFKALCMSAASHFSIKPTKAKVHS